jgi:hypothetical protein
MVGGCRPDYNGKAEWGSTLFDEANALKSIGKKCPKLHSKVDKKRAESVFRPLIMGLQKT